MCCVTSGLCDRLITRSEESYQVCPIVCTLETTKNKNRRPRHDFGFSAIGKKKVPKQYQLVLLLMVRWRQDDAEIVYI